MLKDLIVNNNFKNAIIDYSHFLERDYPYKAILKIIGDKYLLTGLQRSILLRGITTKKKALYRKSKLILKKDLYNKSMLIDCYNVLITISSYISGKFVFIGNDGFLRDAAESHGKIKKRELLDKALELLLNYLKTLDLKEAIFFSWLTSSIFRPPARWMSRLARDHEP